MMPRTLDLIGRLESGGNYDRVFSGISEDMQPFVLAAALTVVQKPKWEERVTTVTLGEGHNRKVLNVVYMPLTEMTVSQVLAWQDLIDPYHYSEAAGKYQVMEDTLRELLGQNVVGQHTVFDAGCQDRLAIRLMKRRGLSRVGKTLTMHEFCVNLAKEWASLPLVDDVEKNGRTLKRGSGYYDGVGNNKALIDPAELLTAVQQDLGTKIDPYEDILRGAGGVGRDRPEPERVENQKKITLPHTVGFVQERLAGLGYPTGKADGMAGPATKRAIAAFQCDNDLELTGEVTEGLVEQLTDPAVTTVKVDPVRANATAKDLRNAGSTTVKSGDAVCAGGGVLATVGSFVGIEGITPHNLEVVEQIASAVQQYWWLALVLAGGGAALVGTRLIRARLNDHRSGRNMAR